MNVSELFIRRPVMTVLVMIGLVVFGIVSYRSLPISDLPTVDYPTGTVNASLPGASPQTMAAAVATPLEKQFATISGIDNMTSSSSLGATSITLQFSLDRDGPASRRPDPKGIGDRASDHGRSDQPAHRRQALHLRAHDHHSDPESPQLFGPRHQHAQQAGTELADPDCQLDDGVANRRHQRCVVSIRREGSGPDSAAEHPHRRPARTARCGGRSDRTPSRPHSPPPPPPPPGSARQSKDQRQRP